MYILAMHVTNDNKLTSNVSNVYNITISFDYATLIKIIDLQHCCLPLFPPFPEINITNINLILLSRVDSKTHYELFL
jgi:hypothetical protein